MYTLALPVRIVRYCFFFFNDTATTEIYTLSLHDALPIYGARQPAGRLREGDRLRHGRHRSEEHTSELQSLAYLVCRLLLEKKKTDTDHVAVRYGDVDQHTMMSTRFLV